MEKVLVRFGLVAVLLCSCFGSFGGSLDDSLVQDSPRQKLRAVYTSQVGVREKTGRNDGPQVKLYLRAIGLPEGYAWCSAFVVWCCQKAGIKVPPFGRAASWFTPERTIYVAGRDRPVKGMGHGQLRHRHDPLVVPMPGDLVGYDFSPGRITHVGFLDDSGWAERSSVYTVEGNTNLAGSREGNGVWRNLRHKRMIYAVARVSK